MEKEYQERNLKIEEDLKKDLESVKVPNDLVIVKAKYLGKTGIVSEYIRLFLKGGRKWKKNIKLEI